LKSLQGDSDIAVAGFLRYDAKRAERSEAELGSRLKITVASLGVTPRAPIDIPSWGSDLTRSEKQEVRHPRESFDRT